MRQINTRLLDDASLTHRLDPVGALVGYATVCAEIPDERPAAREPSWVAFVPSYPFQSSAPTSKALAPTTELADAGTERIAAPCSQGQPGSWLARLWSRYVAWREHRRAAAAWDMLDARTLRDIGALPDEIGHDAQSAACSGWYTVL